ncbi:uncharacterized protein E0L32_010893 [Thyridium curvatum]|uniref:Uncharacterized protein n=1 Tax=Thyridium curvatum TaxID=1093900 RepID=A0A507ASJ4_9PEZI|nr:uncharacterized protein E0L32_010893 [Thyridium curvatum]TPX07190.1 hypothetical protein E0L32_010893 [Thyridium curvatum]
MTRHEKRAKNFSYSCGETVSSTQAIYMHKDSGHSLTLISAVGTPPEPAGEDGAVVDAIDHRDGSGSDRGPTREVDDKRHNDQPAASQHHQYTAVSGMDGALMPKSTASSPRTRPSPSKHSTKAEPSLPTS